MVWHADNQSLLRYLGIASAAAGLLFLRAGSWTVSGILLGLSGTAFALSWLSAQAHHR